MGKIGFKNDQKEKMRQLYIDGYSLKEIANIFGCVPGTVRNIVHKKDKRKRTFLTESQKAQIKIEHMKGATQVSLGKKYGCSTYLIHTIVNQY